MPRAGEKEQHLGCEHGDWQKADFLALLAWGRLAQALAKPGVCGK